MTHGTDMRGRALCRNASPDDTLVKVFDENDELDTNAADKVDCPTCTDLMMDYGDEPDTGEGPDDDEDEDDDF